MARYRMRGGSDGPIKMSTLLIIISLLMSVAAFIALGISAQPMKSNDDMETFNRSNNAAKVSFTLLTISVLTFIAAIFSMFV